MASSSSSNLSKMQQAMDDILAVHAKDLHNQIHTFPAKAQKEFFDQVTRRYVPQPDDVAAYIEKGGDQMRNSYLNIVHELLHQNPYNGFYPPVMTNNSYKVKLSKFFDKMKQSQSLAYTQMDVVEAHLTETLICYPWMQTQPVTNLLKLVGAVNYVYNGIYYPAFVTIYLSELYPKDPPQVCVVCPTDSAINHECMHVSPSGLVSIPYLMDWDGQSSTLLQLLLHLGVEFTSQPPTFLIDVGIPLSHDQRELLKIILDYLFMHLYYAIRNLTPQETYAFFNAVIGRYPKGIADLAQHIRNSKGGVQKFMKTVADILGQPLKTRSTVDLADHHFLQ